jgi:hypothetical protein
MVVNENKSSVYQLQSARIRYFIYSQEYLINAQQEYFPNHYIHISKTFVILKNTKVTKTINAWVIQVGALTDEVQLEQRFSPSNLVSI